MSRVTALGMDIITEKSGHCLTPLAVSVCTTPAAPSPIPVPYPVVARSGEGLGASTLRTKINGAPVATVGSVFSTCHGNEPGTLKEVVSLNTSGPCFLIVGAPVVLCELGMMGITGSLCVSNKAPTPGASSAASGAGGAGGAGGGGGGPGGGAGGGPSGPGRQSGGAGPGGGASHSGAAPGTSSGPPEAHQCQNGHPVDVVTGDVVDQSVDLDLPGAIPLVWKRTYSSARRADKEATLGPGWAHGFEQRITEGERVIALREAEGRLIYFARIAPGEATFHRRERMTLRRDARGGFLVERLADRLTYEFAPAPGHEGGPALLRAIRDAWGNTIALEHDGGRLSRVVDTAGREVRVLWKEGRISRLEVRAEGRLEQWVDYQYSSFRCLTAAVDALGHAEQYEYDRHQRMTAAILKRGARFQYEYEPGTGRCLRTWGPQGLYAVTLRADPATHTTIAEGEEPRIYTWNDQGLATREATPDGTILEERAYDDDGYLIAEVNGAGEGTQYWHDARGNLVREVDAAGNVTVTEHDARDLPARRIAPDGLVTSFAHDDQGALTAITRPSGERTWFTYDERGRLTGVHGAEGRLWSFEYDAQHNLVADTDARGARTTYAYDGMGRPVARTDALGRTTHAVHDQLGRCTMLRYPDGTTAQAAYDGMGQPLRLVDRLGRITQLEHAGMGVVTSIVQPDGSTWSFKYTSTERLQEIKNPRGEKYAFTYDDAGRVIAETTFDGRTLAYAYAASGRVARISYPDGSWRAFSHDRVGRLVGEDASDGSTVDYQRDRLGRLAGALLSEQGRRALTLFERDALGRVVAERQDDRAIRYTHDARGRRVERLMPDGARTRYTYDAAGALVAVDHNSYRVTFERDALGRETRRSAGGGRIAIQRAYDAMDRLIEQRATAPSPGGGVPAVLVQRHWAHDRAGRVTRIDDARWGATTYGYDKSDQLIEARRGAHREVFEYDPAGSLLKILEGLDTTPKSAPAWEVQPGNLVTRTDRAKYAYDKRGRRVGKLELTRLAGGARPTRDDLTEYTWDCRDRLREVKLPGGTRVAMTYDAFGRRVRKEVIPAPGTGKPRAVDFVWDGDALAAAIDSGRGPRTFVHEPGTLVPLLQEERGEVFTHVNDHLGTPKELIDEAGLVAWSAAHSAWGRVLETYSHPTSEQARDRKVESPFRLLGQVADEDTGLCWTRFRCFDPEVGRWCSPDPLGIAGGLNLFGFDGSPTLDVDALGLATGSPHGGNDPSRRVRPGGARPGDLLERRGTAPETADSLDEQAKRAHAAGFPHGVSVTSRARNQSMGVGPEAVSSASRQAFESAGFPVHYTPGQGKRNPDLEHHTVELPDPVTPVAAERFNQVLGRQGS